MRRKKQEKETEKRENNRSKESNKRVKDLE